MKFRVHADFKNPADREYKPAWETEIEADFTGDAYEKGLRLFQEYCEENGLDPELYQVHAGTP